MYTATYSPEDNKLRLYSSGRLPADLYAKVRSAGFIYAPKQELFVAPAWSPNREDLLIELCGEIGDEDTSLVDRAEQRAERFEDYSDKRAADSERASEAVKQITSNIPLGQPILIGHHSEKHARKDAERIENGMKKAVKMWETSKYWTSRAAGALRHAKYKELPMVRANRIKTIEAEIRSCYAKFTPKDDKIIMQSAWNYDTHSDTGEKVPHVWCAPRGGRSGSWVEVSKLPALKEHYTRWINHLENRLAYEKAMLDEQGASELIAPKKRPDQLPLVNYRAPQGIVIENRWKRGEFSTWPQIEMTKAEFAKIYSDNKGTETVENSHRVRMTIQRKPGDYSRVAVFLTDSKVHEKPEPITPTPKTPKMPLAIRETAKETPDQQENEIRAIRDTLKAGISTVSAPQLFPTPPDIAAHMVELADLQPGITVLEPSAGTGNIVRAIIDAVDTEIVGVEINRALCNQLNKTFPSYKLHTDCADFLSLNGELGTFDRIIMNPPFENGADIKHIKHAFRKLNPGGKLVALCANGPRQREAFKDQAEYWEDLPEGSFKSQGTGVNVALMILTA